jgi:NitT/TauT family transport system substrate-binding protein
MKAKAVQIALVLIVASSLLSCSQHSHKIRIGFKYNAAYQHFFVAQENHYFERHGLEVEGVPFESTNQMVQAVARGEIDATAGSSTEPIVLVEQNTPGLMKIYLTVIVDKQHPFYSLLVRVDSPIKTLADLKNTRIGTLPGSTSQSWLEAILSHFLDPKHDVVILQIEQRLQLQALASGQVDAIYTADPTVTLAEVSKIGRVLMKGPEHDYILGVMPAGGSVVSQRLIDTNPRAVRNLIAAMDDAVDFMRIHENETRWIFAKYTHLEPSLAAHIDILQFWKLSETNLDMVQQYFDFLQAQHIVQKHISAAELYLPATWGPQPR